MHDKTYPSDFVIYVLIGIFASVTEIKKKKNGTQTLT